LEEDKQTLVDHFVESCQEAGISQTREDISALAKQFALGDFLDMPLIALSNGQTRRARIVKALLSKPELLILEEPFSMVLQIHINK